MEKLIAGAAKLGLSLTPEQIAQFQTLYEELVDWNQRMNLTSITAYEDVQIKHFLDSLTVTLALKQPITDRTRLIDIGTGAGIPGLPLKIVFPNLRLTLLEATTKKTVFLQHVVGQLGMDKVFIVAGRAEELACEVEYRENFDIALARGVAPLVTLVELTLPFCKIGGRLIAQKREPLEAEAKLAGRAIKSMGGKLMETRNIDLDEFPDNRRLVVVEKVMQTPAQFPRRNGVPAKKPLV